MFDVAFSELLIVGLVSLLLLGPKDSILMLKTVANYIKKLKTLWLKYKEYVIHSIDKS